ncbi:MAG: HAD family hydrolase [Nocardioidaceae bacterium]
MPLLQRWANRPGRAVIFDFNGTLSDDEPILLQIYTELLSEHLGWRLTPEHYYSQLAGRSDREVIETVVRAHARTSPELVATLLAGRRQRYCELVAETSPIRPASAALVRRLAIAGVPIAVVTGAQRMDARFVLDRSDAGRHIAVLVTEEDVTRGKPDPEGFCLAAKLMGVERSACLVFEDSIPGLRAARAAGMTCIAVAGTQSRDALSPEADAVIDPLAVDLFDVVLPR